MHLIIVLAPNFIWLYCSYTFLSLDSLEVYKVAGNLGMGQLSISNLSTDNRAQGFLGRNF